MNSSVKLNWKVRKPNYQFSDETQRYWLDNSIFKTHLANALTILFPDVEKFFVRAVKNFVPDENKRELRKAALTFIGQETQHSIQHEKFWKNLKAQGYELDEFLNSFRKFAFDFIESVHSEEARLALTAGLEHYTALLAEVALKEDLFRNAEPEMKKLFEWHCAEELEHKSVAFDLLQETNPDYVLRIYGMVLASVLMLYFIPMTTFHLIAKDEKLFSFDVWKEATQFLFLKHSILPKATAIFMEYFHPNFHPSQRDNVALIQKVEMPENNSKQAMAMNA